MRQLLFKFTDVQYCKSFITESFGVLHFQQITVSTEDVFAFMSRSLAKLQQTYLNLNIIDMCKDSLQKLIDLGLVQQTRCQRQETEGYTHNLEVTQLGRATFKGTICIYPKNKGADQLHSNCAADQRLCFPYIDR